MMKRSKCYFATEPIDSSPEGKLMESIFEGFSEYYIKDLEMKTSRGMTENAIKGKFNGGTVTFGYQIDSNGQFQKHPINAPIVKVLAKRKIFKKITLKIL